MHTFEQLEALWQAGPAPAQDRGRLHLIVVRRAGGGHDTPASGQLDPTGGLIGDRWALAEAPNPDAQITLMNVRVAELCGAGEQPLDAPGDNLLVDLDLALERLPAGTRLRVGAAELEVTAKTHTGCHKFAARFGQDALRWVNWHQHRTRRLRGINCRIVSGGTVAVGDPIEIVLPR